MTGQSEERTCFQLDDESQARKGLVGQGQANSHYSCPSFHSSYQAI
jgi:hypothetical protein